MLWGSVLACVAALAVIGLGNYLQHDALLSNSGQDLQCGHWCIYRCSWMMGAPIEMEEVRKLLPPDPCGHSLLEIKEALGSIGFTATGYRETSQTLTKGQFPCIIHLSNPDHFVVASSVADSSLLVFDGTGVRRRISKKVLTDRWTGNVLRLQRDTSRAPLPHFQQRSVVAACAQFDVLHIDKGDVSIGEQVIDFVYPFSNYGSEPLVIENVETDCGCMEAVRPTEPVPPGGRSQIVIKYHAPAAGKKGTFEHVAIIESNDPTYPLMPLYASGNTDARVGFLPTSIDFGRMVPDHPKTSFFFVRYQGENTDSFRIEGVKCSIPQVQVRRLTADEAIDAIRIKGHPTPDVSDHVRVLQLTIDGVPFSSDQRELVGELEFTTSVAGVGAIVVPIRAESIPPVAAVPNALTFGELTGKADAPAQASLALRSVVGEDVRVTKVVGGDSEGPIDFSQEKGPGETRLMITCNEAAARSRHKSVLKIHLESAGDQTVVPIMVYAWAPSKQVTAHENDGPT